MAGLYYDQDPAFVLDSFLVTNSLDNMSSFNEYGTYFYPMLSNHEYLEEIPLDIQIHETSPLYRSCSVETPFSCASNDPSLSTVVKHESDSSVMVAEQLFNASADKFTQARTPMQEKTKNTDRKAKERRIKRIPKKQKKVPEEASSGYVLVRARRGEATDSHSLAERVRREKISVRMKQLQSLVPGCDQMTGKVLILDHIIKYVQTLQTQVQFLAAKLVSVNPVCLSDCKVNLDTNTVAQEMTSSLDFQPPTVPDFSSTQIESISSESSTLITPNFMLLDQEQRSNITFQDNDNLQLWGADDCWINELANYSELYNISSF